MKTKLGIVMMLLLLAAGQAQGADYGFGYQPSLGAATAAVADQLGFFRAEGVALETRIFNDGTLINEALAAGAIQFGVVGDMPTITALAARLPVKVVAAVGGGGKRERLMVRDSEVTAFSELQGKRIGVTRGTSGFNAFQLLCQKYGYELTEFKLINIRPANMPEALASAQVDAVLTWEPTPSLIEAAGLGRELLNLKDSELIFPLTLVVRTSVLENDPEAVRKVLKALRRAAEFIQENPTKAGEVVAKISGLSPELAQRSLGYHFYEVGWTPQVENSLKKTAQMLWEQKELRALPDWDTAIDASFCSRLGY
ncbi:MAG: ABC transporter substrate-binding protein [Firmicutes bacterium]|nr:ABC transporter substrate-binding protein [Bacillota bacterium]